jgi:hypothetical protein
VGIQNFFSAGLIGYNKFVEKIGRAIKAGCLRFDRTLAFINMKMQNGIGGAGVETTRAAFANA